MFLRRASFGVVAVVAAAIPCAGQSATTPTTAPVSAQAPGPSGQAFLKSTEVFVRKLFAWGPEIPVKVGPLSQSSAADFYVVPIQVTLNGQTENGEVYMSKDAKTLLRGEIFDTSVDPFASNQARIHVDGSPSKGRKDARVTVVEYADFECPHCRELYGILKVVEAEYPQVRFVYKDFPLAQIHPWAETAAIGARCAFMQSPPAFWKIHDALFDNQDVISPENVWDKLVEYASQAGLNTDVFITCLASPDSRKPVEADHAEGVALGISSTPTVYINGRPQVGGDLATLQQYINFELAAQKK
jgi:protein-disulfide isomerase